VATALRRWALGYAGLEDSGTEDLATQLCHCEFSLAYGGRILLTGAALHLLRGRRYGLCGPNGAGKTTLLKTIARGDLEGFPSKSELRSVYVGHDIDASTAAASAVDWIFEDPEVKTLKPQPPTRSEVESALEEMGFSATMRGAAVASLSGGWRMKLALARAAILRADILLLDEPTNHLDVANVAWLEDWLVAAPRVAAVVVSHDAPFLESIATDIINFETGKLVHYHGGLREFVAARPEAAAFLEGGEGDDGAAQRRRGPAFVLPDPGYLDGIKTRTQPVMRLNDVSFRYPGAAAPLLNHITLRASMGSRVAVTGANGAGKSTLVKLLIGELSPENGGAWRHPNLRVAYVAQHAFHHIEDHLDRTPAEYFWWRFGGGDDREALRAIAAKVSPEAAAARDAAIARGERVVDYLNSRRMNGKSKDYEYEAAWVGQSSRQNSWLSRKELRDVWSAEAMAEALDARLAAFRTHRPLSTPVVTAHLAGFGLTGEVASATRIAGLSGGQKVRLVLAGAMWVQPHFLVLDEPTNYLDAGALDALAAGIAGFRGGSLMITHHAAWAAELCTEEWVVQGGGLTVRAMAAEGGAGAGEGGAEDENGGAIGGAEDGGSVIDNGEEAMDPEALEAELALRAVRREEKERIAAEKAAKKAERAKLRFSKKF
jgi:elongation factor 3